MPIQASDIRFVQAQVMDDVPEGEMCGVQPNRTFPVNERYHAILCSALDLPDVAHAAAP